MMKGHISVLYQECLDALLLKPDKLMVDGTLGGGGHAEGMLQAGCRLIGIDKDGWALERCRERLSAYAARLQLVQDDFKNIRSILKRLDVTEVDGALLDLGVSSFQLDQQERGFSYTKEAPLDMRMDTNAPLSAYQVVNEYSEESLRRILFTYGEEKFAGRIAAAIVAKRPIETTVQLAEIIKEAIPAARRRTGGHPAKRSFQAIRIEVNGELEGLKQAVEDFIHVLRPGGRLAIITFHSLEDRAVKQAMKQAENPCICPPDFPKCVCGREPQGRCITRKPILPAAREIEENNRARSAKLRVFEKRI